MPMFDTQVDMMSSSHLLNLMLNGSSSTVLALFFLGQLVLAVIVAFVSLWLLPASYQKQHWTTTFYLFVLSVAVPFGSLIICLLALKLAYRFPLKAEASGIVEVGLPAFESSLVERMHHGSGARLRVQLDNRNASADERMTALLAMQNIPKRTASPILRTFLWDSVEDVRLLMYAMLDGAEKDITLQIHVELPLLASSLGKGNERRRFGICAHLAHLYWELIYQNLVQDDILAYTIEQADLYAKMALDIDPTSASLWYMRGRLALTRKQVDEAESYLLRAAAEGFQSDRLLPFMAECAYLNKQYGNVRSSLNAFENRSTLPFLQPLQRYWTQ